MGMALLILSLLVSFNRTINRLTKPVSALAVFSLLSSALISACLYFKKKGVYFGSPCKFKKKLIKSFNYLK